MFCKFKTVALYLKIITTLLLTRPFDNATAFTKAGKLKSGQERAHKFNENCFGTISPSLTKEIQERLTRMQRLKDKLKRMYPMIKEGSTSKTRRKKENRTKSNKRKNGA